MGDIESTENPVDVTVDAPMHVVAEFIEVSAAVGLDLVSDLNALLTAAGESTADTVFDEGNGIPDAAEMMVLEEILGDAQYNRVPYSGTGHQTVYDAWVANLVQAEIDLASQSAPIQRAIAAYMTLGESGHVAFAVASALEVASVTLDTSLYSGASGLGALGDADGDTHWNRLEWVAVLEYYQVTTPTSVEAAIYVTWVLDPSLPTDENIDIGMDLPDGDGTNWDYSYLPQGTVTFNSVQDLPIEVRILDPPGREDVPVPIGQPVDIPLGAELLVKIAEGANSDWFYTWSATGNMIDGSGEKAERFRLMRSGTIQPTRRSGSITLPVSPTGEGAYTFEWSGRGAFGHLVAAGSSSGGNIVDVPIGSFLKLRAYKSKQPPGTKSVDEDRQYANKWSYEYGGTEPAYCWGSSPTFYIEIASQITPMWAPKPTYGLWTHTVTASEGGYACIGDEQGGLGEGANGGLYGSVGTPARLPGQPLGATLKVAFIPEPGYELDDWTGDFAPGAPVESRAQNGSVVTAKMQGLHPTIIVNGTYGTPAEAGHLTADAAKRWYSSDGTEYVEFVAYAHPAFVFEWWMGPGVAFLDNGNDEPDIGNPISLDDEENHVTADRIWLERGAGEDIRERVINGCMKFSIPTVLITPAGHPVESPVASGDGQNEFTFNASIPQYLDITLKAGPIVPGIPASFIKFSIDDIPDTTKVWAPENPGGRATLSGIAYVATVRFWGIPENNDSFEGDYKAGFRFKDIPIQVREFEIFFARDEFNHPQDEGTKDWPNWMYYWLQTITPSPHDVVYIPAGQSAHNVQPNKIYVGSDILDVGGYDPAYAPERLFGIELFGWAMDHESRHLDVWRDHWSYDRNLWHAAVGLPGPNNDSDSDCLKTSFEDTNQDGLWNQGSERYDFQNTATNQAPDWPMKLVDVEDKVCFEGKNAKGDRHRDWGDPGFQHLTENFND